MELLRKDLQALGEQCHMGCVDGHFAGLCPEYFALDADHVAYVQFLELFIIFLAHAVSGHVGLDIAFQILYVAERSLAHHTLGHHASRDGYGFPFQFIKIVFDLLAVMCLLIFRDHERVFAVLLQLRKFLTANLSQLVQILFLSVILLCHCSFLLSDIPLHANSDPLKN